MKRNQSTDPVAVLTSHEQRLRAEVTELVSRPKAQQAEIDEAEQTVREQAVAVELGELRAAALNDTKARVEGLRQALAEADADLAAKKGALGIVSERLREAKDAQLKVDCDAARVEAAALRDDITTRLREVLADSMTLRDLERKASAGRRVGVKDRSPFAYTISRRYDRCASG